jgi:putative nucleotidyltransferase with HDIG domain
MSLLHTNPSLKIIKSLAQTRKTDVYLVGGFLRDYFLDKQKLDFDFAVSAGALNLAKSFARRIGGSYVLLDKERGCARVCKKERGTLATYDFADFRAKTFKGDLARRDFTVNTLALCVNTLSASDTPASALIANASAKKDLSGRRIRMMSARSFIDDPLRILRAYSLCAQHGFRIEAKTLAQMKKDAKRLAGVSPERVRDELFKVLSSDDCGRHLRRMDNDGMLEYVIPQVRIMDNCKQGTYHHLDVWPHSLETVSQLDGILRSDWPGEGLVGYLQEPVAGERKRLHIMRLAALLHDIGKPQTRKVEKGRVSFHGHEHVGKQIVRGVAKMLKLSTRESHMLEDMVQWHLRPGYLSNFKKPSERMVYRYFRDAGQEAASIAIISLADQRSTRGPATTQADQLHHEKICRELIRRFVERMNAKPFVPLINGDDLIKKLKLEPSPLFARILADVRERQSLGKLKSKNEALVLAKEIADKETQGD